MSRVFFTSWTLALALALTAGPAAADSARQRTRIDDGWRFALGRCDGESKFSMLLSWS